MKKKYPIRYDKMPVSYSGKIRRGMERFQIFSPSFNLDSVPRLASALL
jgi:hypothetical protein